MSRINKKVPEVVNRQEKELGYLSGRVSVIAKTKKKTKRPNLSSDTTRDITIKALRNFCSVLSSEIMSSKLSTHKRGVYAERLDSTLFILDGMLHFKKRKNCFLRNWEVFGCDTLNVFLDKDIKTVYDFVTKLRSNYILRSSIKRKLRRLLPTEGYPNEIVWFLIKSK